MMKKSKWMGVLLSTILLTTIMPTYIYADETYVNGGSYTNSTIQVCKLPINEKDYKSASLLYDGRYIINQQSIIASTSNYLTYTPNPKTVEKSVIHLFKELELEGVNIDEFLKYPLKMSILNAKFQGVLGHAFMNVSDPNIYIYSSSNIQSEKEIFDTTIHEMGHYVDLLFFTPMDRAEYALIRNIPFDYNNNQSQWEKRPQEIFAEDFKNIFFPAEYSHFYKTNLDELTSDQESQIKNLIIKVIKRNQTVDMIDEYEDILNLNILGESYLKCDEQMKEKYLLTNTTQESFVDLFLKLIQKNSPDYLKSEMSLKEQKVNIINNTDFDFSTNNKITYLDIQKVFNVIGPVLYNKSPYNYRSFFVDFNKYSPNKELTNQDTLNFIRDFIKNEKIDNEIDNNILSFNDINNENLENILNYLVNQDIIKGYKDNTFRPNSKITNEEVTTILMRLIGASNSAELMRSSNDNWSKPYLNIAKNYKLLTGDINKDVTILEASKKFLSTIGYSVNSYNKIEILNLSKDLGLFQNINFKDSSEYLTREQIAYMINNVLDIPIVYSEGFVIQQQEITLKDLR